MKKAQISMEVMYSVGVMIIIFLILTGISFNRRSEVRKLDELVEKRNECLKLADYLTSINTFGDFSYLNVVNGNSVVDGCVVIRLKNNASIFNNGVIVIQDADVTERSVEATCTFNANIDTSFIPLQPFIDYYIQNYNRTVKIKSATGSRCVTSTPY